MNRHRIGLAAALVLGLLAGTLQADIFVRDAKGQVLY